MIPFNSRRVLRLFSCMNYTQHSKQRKDSTTQHSAEKKWGDMMWAFLLITMAQLFNWVAAVLSAFCLFSFIAFIHTGWIDAYSCFNRKILNFWSWISRESGLQLKIHSYFNELAQIPKHSWREKQSVEFQNEPVSRDLYKIFCCHADKNTPIACLI